MSDIRFNQWLHQSGTGGVSQVASGAVGVGTTNPLADFYVRGDAQITGILTAGHIAMGSSITFGDDDRAYFGDGTDLQIYHDGTDSIIDFTNTAHNLRIRGDNEIRLEARYNELSIRAVKNAYVELYYDASNHPDAKLQTSEKGIKVGTGVTIETNGQATYTGIVTATAFKLANGSDVGTGAGGTWSTYTAGIATSKSVGVNTSTLDDNDLVGVGNSFQGLYISNGMMITDNTLNGNHYIGTAFNGLMAGPVSIEGTLTIDGNYVVV